MSLESFRLPRFKNSSEGTAARQDSRKVAGDKYPKIVLAAGLGTASLLLGAAPVKELLSPEVGLGMGIGGVASGFVTGAVVLYEPEIRKLERHIGERLKRRHF